MPPKGFEGKGMGTPSPIEEVPKESGTTDTFEQGLLEMRRPLLAFALNLVRNQHDAEDLVSITMEKALKSKESFDGSNLRAWLFTILRNTRYTQSVRQTHEGQRLKEIELRLGSTVDGVVQNDARLELKEVAEKIKLLSPIHQEALKLVALEGLSYEQAAERLKIPVGTVKTRVMRARESLSKMTGRAEEGSG